MPGISVIPRRSHAPDPPALEFLAPSLRTAPLPVLHLELLPLAVAVARFGTLPTRFLQPEPWIAAALVSAEFVSLGRAIDEPH
ncbi:hypothetical protein [Nocardia anaemiae]|uniref:hypothetical protein n=1 Tax=Nocardia anaemiae TaxID=263910 RepID=UPI0012F4BBBD|nr:hypothetical protein [Nocardia anaemiae]